MDILLVSETKSDYTFPNGQFLIKDCSSPLDLNGIIMVEVSWFIFIFIKDMPSKLISSEKLPLSFEINLRKPKYLMSCSYNLYRTSHKRVSHSTKKKYRFTYFKAWKTCFLRWFWCRLEIKGMCNLYGLTNLKNKVTCYKNPGILHMF